MIIFLYVLRYSFNTITQANVTTINLSSISKIKKEVINDIINLPIIFHDLYSSQYILNRINEVDNLANLFSSELINFIIGSATAIVAFVIIVNTNLIIAGFALLSLPLFFLIAKNLFSKMHDQVHDLMEVSAKVNEDIYSNIDGTMTLKQFNSESEAVQKIGSQIDILIAKTKTKNLSINRNSNFIIALVYILQNILLGIVAILINKEHFSIGHYLSISQYLSLVYVPILSYQSININIKPAIVAYKRITKLYSRPIKSKVKSKIKSVDQLIIKDLTFHYPNLPNILEGINLSLCRGDKVLLYGSNGSGKTTLSKIILGFYNDYEGSIFLNSTELREIDSASLRDNISILPQKIFLFNMSIEENIRIANKRLSDKEFEEKMRYFNNIGLLDGIDTTQILSDNGKKLSGGQIQRIALARMLLREADICIFDEYTNSLDSTAMHTIETIIARECNEKICIFITHNKYLSNICNVQLCMDKG
jgi:ABC-type bacteriocin/lantibiotic exporter with double-glycine peptidase domain